jgi:hemimethylated DNA binding protein
MVSPKSGATTAHAFREYSLAATFERGVHPHWEEVKDSANQALASGDIDRAVAGYTNALKIADGSNVDELFSVLAERPLHSAGPRLAALKLDIVPMIQQFDSGPKLSLGEPNLPAAICLANRAAAQLRAGHVSAAVADARAATVMAPEYVKAHYRLRQALLASDEANVQEEAALVGTSMERFRILSEEEPLDRDGRRPPGMWLGFRLVACDWLEIDRYQRIYEDARAREWRELARHIMEDEASMNFDLRVHMEVFHIQLASLLTPDYLAVGLNVIPSRPAHPALAREASWLPSVDYRYIPLPAKLDEQSPSATGRMIAATLGDMLEHDDLPMVTMVGLGWPISTHADTVRRHFHERGMLTSSPGRELDALVVLYTAGRCMKHRNFGYRGVIVGTPDHTCMMSEQWIEQMGVDNLPRGRFQPWYHILVDIRDRSPPQMCYVCHENIILWFDPPDEGSGGPIMHPDVRKAFISYDSEARLYQLGPGSGN